MSVRKLRYPETFSSLISRKLRPIRGRKCASCKRTQTPKLPGVKSVNCRKLHRPSSFGRAESRPVAKMRSFLGHIESVRARSYKRRPALPGPKSSTSDRASRKLRLKVFEFDKASRSPCHRAWARCQLLPKVVERS